jgi:glycosyltransferase involved in cell wall biosynthesis
VRILHVTPFCAPAPAFGGIARASAALARAQAGLGHQVTVLTTRTADEPRESVVEGVRVVRLPARGLARRLPFVRGLRHVLEQEWPAHDVLHLHGHRHGLALRVAALAGRLGAYVLQPHGTAPHHGQKRWLKELFDAAFGRGVIEKAARLVAVSRAEAADLPRPSTVVGNGVLVPTRTRPPRRAGPPRLLFVGNGSPQKRADRLAPLLQQVPEAELVLVGPLDSLPAGLEGLGRRVSRRGVLDGDELWSAYEDTDLLVQPAVGEAFGLAAFEAALLGTPAVVVGGHGAGEWFGAAGGCVVPPDDPGALTHAVGERLADPVRAAGEAAAVATFARARLTWEEIASRMTATYGSAAGASAVVA